MNLIKNKYYFQALDSFPYDMEQVIESLNYALSYDEKDADALCLMGRVYAEILHDYEVAKNYFEEAMVSNMYNLNLYSPYIDCLINNEDYDQAKKLIKFAKGIKGVKKYQILLKEALLKEHLGKYKKALKCIKEAKNYAYNSDEFNEVEERKKQVLKKMKSKEKEE